MQGDLLKCAGGSNKNVASTIDMNKKYAVKQNDSFNVHWKLHVGMFW